MLRAAFVLACLCLGTTVAAPAPIPQPQMAALWQRLGKAAWVAQGAQRPRHILYMITDANCPFCHDLWVSLQPLYAHQLQVRYVMVGILSPDSPGKAAAILEARNPSAALTRSERNWGRLSDDLGGGIAPLRKPKPGTTAALESNEQLMHDLGVQGTPALVYRGRDHALHVIPSALDPAKLKAVVAMASL